MKKADKILIILLILVIVSGIILFSLQKYIENKNNIRNIIGNDVGSSSVSISEYALLAERTIGVYLRYLRENKLEEAYSLLFPTYKEVVTLEDFKNGMASLDISSYSVLSIARKTENMYIAYVDMSDGNHEMLIIFNEDKFWITPEPFLKYVSMDKSISKNGVEYNLIGYQINVNSCIFDLKITNTKNEDITISGSDIKMESGYTIKSENDGNANFVVHAGEEKIVHILFKTNLNFPVEFEIDREDNQKIRMYKFKLEK